MQAGRIRIYSISIHSLRMEGDIVLCTLSCTLHHFNPLPPHGGRHTGLYPIAPTNVISIHSLRMEGDKIRNMLRTGSVYFNPLPPHGGRRYRWEDYQRSFPNFNPLPPHGGRQTLPYMRELLEVFQSTPSAWRET